MAPLIRYRYRGDDKYPRSPMFLTELIADTRYLPLGSVGFDAASIGMTPTGPAAANHALVQNPSGSVQTAFRVEQNNSGTQDAVKIVNSGAAYALKIDQLSAGGARDAVNIVAQFTGAHTALGVVASNTTLSTVKITNDGVQTGGQVIAGIGSNASRTAAIFGATNSGSGAAYLAQQEAGATGVGFQATYDAGSTYTSRGLWISGRHTSGQLATIENASAQTSGSLLTLVQNNAATAASCLALTQAGTGDLMTASNFSINNQGFVRTPQLFNNASFNNARIQLTNSGMVVDRTVADANATLAVQNLSASNTGDTVAIYGAGNVLGSRFNKNAYFMTRKTAAPADADLAAGELALWFDSTNGAAKLMVKAKEAGGTVRAAQVALA